MKRRNSVLKRITAAAIGLALASATLIAAPLASLQGAAAAEPAATETTASASGVPTAPVTLERRIIENVHTDTVSVFVDDGKLVLGSKADINGPGYRIDTDSTLFHLEAASRTTTANTPEFLRRLGSDMWLAPQTQDPALIWPGFSTEHDPLVNAADDGKVSLELINTKGPGRVELFLSGGFGELNRVFSSTDKLPAWSMGMRQHTHMNWAFGAQGRYELTFRATAKINGKNQTAERTYSFYVGPKNKMTSGTGMLVAADRGQLAPGESLQLRAEFDPASARGWVEYGDAATGQVLGVAEVKNGVARLATSALNPGQHEITARFIPQWADEYEPVVLKAGSGLPIQVTGDVIERPEQQDGTPVPDASLTDANRGQVVRIPKSAKTVDQHATVTASARQAAGQWVSVWQHTAQGQQWLGWVQVGADGSLTVRVADAKPGAAKLVLKSTSGELLGWDAFTIRQLDVTPGEVPQPPRGGSNNRGGHDSGQQPSQKPDSAAQTCEPSLVLDTGHVDAFNVSVSTGGQAVLQLKEDVTGSHVLHEAEDVLLRVNQSAYEGNIPASLPGSPSGYVLPLAQRSDLVWPGWDTNRTTSSGYTDVTINIHSVEGPGSVHLYSMGSFGDLKPLLDGGSTRLPGSLREPTPAHTHAQWVFSEAGIYVLTVSATATNPSNGQSATTATHRYVFQVGDVPLGDVFCKVTASADSRAASAAVNDNINEQETKAAEAAKQAKAKEKEKARQRAAEAVTAAEADSEHASDAAAAVTDPERERLLLWAAIGGGALAIGGIGYGTLWYLRRLRGVE